MQLQPDDDLNRRLAQLVRPGDWHNPRPSGRYNLVAIGGGAAGLVSAAGTAGLGGKAALVERALLGGDCLLYGCVPSKALLRSARCAYEVRQAERFGVVGADGARVDFAAVMQRMRSLRADLGRHDSADRFAGLGVDVFLGPARFTGPDELEIGGTRLEFHRAVIATGARPAVPEIPGLAETGYLTNETVFSLTELPQRLIVLGAGPIGCELAQAFARFGCQVQLLARSDRILRREEPRAAQMVERQFQAEGIALQLGVRYVRAARQGNQVQLVVARDGAETALTADALLVAVGRQPNVEGLGLEAAGVKYSPRGVEVDDFLRTSNRRIYAAGDVCGLEQFTHAADRMARTVIRNALFLGRQRWSRQWIPRCTYTAPEVAALGLTAAQAAEQGVVIDTYEVDLADVDRAVLDGAGEGYAAVHVNRRTGHMTGATVVAPHAGEMLGELALLASARLPVSALAGVTHCYPTLVEAFRRIADQQQRSRLSPRAARWLRRWLAWRR